MNFATFSRRFFFYLVQVDFGATLVAAVWLNTGVWEFLVGLHEFCLSSFLVRVLFMRFLYFSI